MKINVVGDLTGFYKSFRALARQMPQGELWGLGDLVDRGPDSKNILDYFIDNKLNSVMGNHEHMMLHYETYYGSMTWALNGGGATVKNFGFDTVSEFDLSRVGLIYFNFLRNMPLKKEIDNLLLSHAPINENIIRIHNYFANKDELFLESKIVWNRHNPMKIDGKFQVYGHNSTDGILWHTGKNPEGIYMSDPFEVPEDAWGACIDTWKCEYLTGLHIDTDLIHEPKKAITVFKQEIIDPYIFEKEKKDGKC